MIKIAFFDIDGTLLKMGCKEPTDKTVKALNSLHQNGILLCMATGRGYLSIPKFKDITFDVLLTFNGSYVMAGEKIIFRNPLNNNDKHQIIQNLNKMDRAAAISNEHFIVTNGTDEHLEEYFKFGNETLTIADNFDELCKEDIYQIMCACRKEEYAQILQGTENTQITAWWDKAADIIPLNCGKGNAVNAVTELILAGALLVKNCLGAMAVVVLLLAGAGPVIHYGLLSLSFRFLGAVAQPVSDKRIVGCLGTMGEGCALLLRIMLTAEILCVLTFIVLMASVGG